MGDEVTAWGYKETPERREIMDTLARAERLLHDRAEAHRAARSDDRTNRALNRASVVRCLMDTLAHDWHDDDGAAARQSEAA